MASHANCKIEPPNRGNRLTSFAWVRSRCAVTSSRKGFARVVGLLLGAAALVFSATSVGRSEELWVYDPYRIKVWVVVEQSAYFPQQLQNEIRRRVADQITAEIGSPFRAVIEPIPASLAGRALDDLGAVDAEVMKEVDPDLTSFDKVMLLTFSSHDSDAIVRAREYDTRSRVWSPVQETQSPQFTLLPEIAFDSMLAAFRPLFQVKESYEIVREEVAEAGGEAKKIKLDMVVCELRAGELVGPGAASIVPPSNHVLQPYLRRNSRSGKVSGVDPIPYTYCIVRKREGPRYFCEVRSARGRGAVGASGGRRTEQFALAPPAPFADTVLQISTMGADSSPLAGYEIWDQNIDTGKAELLGATDWQGRIPVPRTPKRPLKLLYVRNGGRLLARLPVAPGVISQVEAQLPDDEMRLNAESVVKGFQSRLMDVMARRQVVAARVRSRIKSGDIPLATTLVEEFRDIDSKRELTVELTRYQADFDTDDRRLRLKITGMFVETQSLIDRFIDTRVASDLASELAEARKRAEGN